MKRPTAIAFLQELLQRLFTKSPVFFKIWTWVSGLLVFVSGVPEILQMLSIELPDPWNTRLSKTVLAAASGMLFMSMLTTSSKPIGVTDSGQVVKKTDECKLPFTAQAEEKEAHKEGGILNPETPRSAEVIETTIQSQ